MPLLIGSALFWFNSSKMKPILQLALVILLAAPLFGQQAANGRNYKTGGKNGRSYAIFGVNGKFYAPHGVWLVWIPGDGTATGFNFYRATSPGGEGSTPVVTGISAWSYADPSVVAGDTYYYTVTAFNANGESAQSNELSATIPSP